jgi:LemA protein
MKKSWIIIGSIVALILIIFMQYRSNFNTANEYQKEVDKAWGNVQSSYQRRADLVPQLVATVKGAAENERGILTAVTQARAGIVNAKTPEDMEMMGKKINTAINLAFEAYPQIRSTENFQALQAQLEGTENRINYSRDEYNAKVATYNTHISGFLNEMLLSKTRFPVKESFKAAEGSENAPKVDFSK